MQNYPYIIDKIMPYINDLSINRSFSYDLYDETFDRIHEFRGLMNYFTNYYNCELIEVSHTNYFIIKITDNNEYGDKYLAITIIENDEFYYLTVLLFDNLIDLKNRIIFDEV